MPLYLFGGIALATAPAPSLSIVNEMTTAGPVTSTLIPMAALDYLVGALVFFTVVALVSAHVSTSGIPVLGVLFLVFLPVPVSYTHLIQQNYSNADARGKALVFCKGRNKHAHCNQRGAQMCIRDRAQDMPSDPTSAKGRRKRPDRVPKMF